MSSQTPERKAYRKWYYENEPKSVKESRKAWKKSPTGKRCVRNTHLKKTYGITLLEYEAKLKEQKGCCAICLKPAATYKKGLGVDHNHITGKNRGLLCFICNTSLAILENVAFCQKALYYIQKHI